MKSLCKPLQANEAKSGFCKLTVYTRNGDSGPGERSRTFTTLRSPDFESGASASSATPGIALHYIMGGVVADPLGTL
jgi:hypothetical protein